VAYISNKIRIIHRNTKNLTRRNFDDIYKQKSTYLTIKIDTMYHLYLHPFLNAIANKKIQIGP